MTNVPQIVRDRLKAAPPLEHLDANLLTAFAERSLSERERAMVLDHLSTCADCREVVALALPATEAVQATLSPKRASWLTWPALRWGLVAAGIVAVALFGVVRYQHESRLQTASLKTVAIEAQNEASSRTAASAGADKAPAHAAYPAPNAPAATPHERRQVPAPPEAKRALVTNPTLGGPLLTGQPQAATQAAPVAGVPLFGRPQPSRSKDLRVPASNEMVEVTGAPTKTEIAQNQPTQALDITEAAVAKSKNAEPAQAASAGASIAGPGTSNLHMLVATSPMLPPARWTISGTGSLHRSFDQGQTWQDVNVLASDTASYNFVYAQKTPEPSATQATKPSLKKEYAAAPMTFRAVTANGLDVWAGGLHGVLYHSADNGNHWTRVAPSSGGVSLTGDVVSLDFPDPQHGKLTTSTPEVWTTADAGQTWQKQ